MPVVHVTRKREGEKDKVQQQTIPLHNTEYDKTGRLLQFDYADNAELSGGMTMIQPAKE